MNNVPSWIYNDSPTKIGAKEASPKIPIEQYLSGFMTKTQAPTVGSFGHAPPRLVELKDSEGGTLWVNVTSNNKYVFSDADVRGDAHVKGKGYPSAMHEEHDHDTWVAAGQSYYPNLFNVVSLPQQTSKSGVLQSFGESPARYHPDDSPVPNFVQQFYVNGIHNNRLGEMFSRIHNRQQDLSDYYRTQHSADLTDFLESQGAKPAYIGAVGVGLVDEKTIMAVNRLVNGKDFITSSLDFNSKIIKQAEAYGISRREAIMFTLDEELMHLALDSYGRIEKGTHPTSEEIRVKSEQRNFYISQARKYAGSKEGRRYAYWAALKQHDIDTTPERYSKDDESHSLEQRVEGSIPSGASRTGTYAGRSVYGESASKPAILLGAKASKYKSVSARTYDERRRESSRRSSAELSEKEDAENSDVADSRQGREKAEAKESDAPQAEGQAEAA